MEHHDPNHPPGTNCYRHGCRCAACRRAHAAGQAAWRRKKQAKFNEVVRRLRPWRD